MMMTQMVEIIPMYLSSVTKQSLGSAYSGEGYSPFKRISILIKRKLELTPELFSIN